MTLADILARLGIIPDTDTGENTPTAGGAMQMLAQSALLLDSAWLALEDPLLKIQALAEAGAARLDAFIRGMRLPADRMEAWMMAAQQHRIPPGEVTDVVESIQNAAGQIRAGGGNRKPWEQLGISPEQDPFDVIDQMHACASAFPPAIVRPMLADAGIGDAFFHLLRQQEPGFHGIGGQGRARASAAFSTIIAEFAQNLMSTASGAASRLSALLYGFRDALRIGDFANAWAVGVPESILAKNLEWMDHTLQRATEPVEDAMRLASSLVEDARKNNLDTLMARIASDPGQTLPSAIPPAFLAQPAPVPAQRAIPDEPAAPPPNTTINVNQYIEGTANPQKAAEEAIRRMIEQTAAQLPSVTY